MNLPVKNELIYGFTPEVHELAERLINTEIYCRDSSLIPDLMKADLAESGIDEFENTYDESPDAIEDFLQGHLEVSLWKGLSSEERKEIAVQHGFEATPFDIYEYWRVSGWLADDLTAIGQPVLKNSYGCWWGRTCTGQPMILDSTIQCIAERLIARTG